MESIAISYCDGEGETIRVRITEILPKPRAKKGRAK
jgi:hypothetical protein